MRILVSNDDGIYSPGIAALARVAARFGEVRVVAPDVEQSGASHAVTSTRPVTYRPTPLDGVKEAYRVNGTPADCVALGAHHWDRVDLVISGINIGANLGNAVWHSGTVAAAKQAALLGIRGIAFSTPITGEDPDFSGLEPHVEACLRALLPEDGLRLVNVNVPPNPQGMCWTRQSVDQYHGRVEADHDPAGRPIYWFTVAPLDEVREGTDLWAVEHGYVSVTPHSCSTSPITRSSKSSPHATRWRRGNSVFIRDHAARLWAGPATLDLPVTGRREMEGRRSPEADAC